MLRAPPFHIVLKVSWVRILTDSTCSMLEKRKKSVGTRSGE
jgi:hypothetical protein